MIEAGVAVHRGATVALSENLVPESRALRWTGYQTRPSTSPRH